MSRPIEPFAQPAHRGFTLVELVIVIVVLSTGLLGIMSVYQQTVARSADPLLQQQALAIAEAHMDEILGRQCGAGSATGGNRADRQWMRDYHEHYGNPPNTAPQDIGGQNIPELSGYRVLILVTYDTSYLNDNVPACRAVVTVTHNTHAAVRVELTGIRAQDPTP